MYMNKGMRKVYAFPRGGLVFEDPFAPCGDVSETAFLPVLSVLPLVQHTGSKAYPIVFIGEYVKEGMLVGRGQGPGSANVHATVPGKVLRMASWTTIDGFTNDALVVRMEGSFEKLGKKETPFSWKELPVSEVQRLIAEYGIVEMNEDGRPVSDILSAFMNGKGPFSLVVRCVFDDPWLAADQALCQERLEALVEGAAIAGRAGKVSRIVYAVSHTEKALSEKLLAAAAAYALPATALLVGSRYPQRNRRELELVLRQYEERENIELGTVLVLGPATLTAIRDAVVLRKPILERYVAVGGSAVRQPCVLKVRIGTRLRDVFEQCGGLSGTPQRIVIGSPLSGRMALDLDEPVIKTSYAVSAMMERQVGGTVARSCIDCGECRSVCPVGLDPESLFKQIKTQGDALSGEAFEAARECHGCGCCEAVCPSRLPLSSAIRAAGKGGV
jgi:electron transport complex protein RnfC